MTDKGSTDPISAETLAKLSIEGAETLRHDTDTAPFQAFKGEMPANNIVLGPVLGKGGMGVVYLGKQAVPERYVAVKKARTDENNLETLLLQEALITGMLEHPNIVPIHEIRHSQSRAVEVIMKRIQGVTLEEHLQATHEEGHVLERALEVLIQTCNALAFAHAKGIVHRDIKPQNIMLGEFGETYLLDWGIAVRLDHVTEFPRGLVGTPRSMAPEMLSGDPADVSPQTDIYLLGATLHEILTGEARHQGKGKALFKLIRASEPKTYGPDVPVQLGELVNQCCHVDPAQRLPTVTLLRDRLQAFLHHRHASDLLESGDAELRIVAELLANQNDGGLERVKLYHHIHRARFAFERALVMDRSLTKARESLLALVDIVTVQLLEEGKHDAAAWFAESSGMLSARVQERLDEARESTERERAEEQRLQLIGASHDPSSSALVRILLTFAVFVSVGMVAYYIISSVTLHRTVLPEELLFEGLTLLVPIILVFVFGRRKLIFDPVGRRAAIGIVGGAICLVLHRWAGVHFDLPSEAIVTTEKFLIGLAFASTAPAIPSGMIIGLICIATGIATVLFPAFILPGSLLMVLYIALFLIRDVYVESNRTSDGR